MHTYTKVAYLIAAALSVVLYTTCALAAEENT